MLKAEFYQKIRKILSDVNQIEKTASDKDALECALQIIEWTDDELEGADNENCIAELERVLPAYLNYRDEEAADYRSVYGD
jgi:chaperonin cofactor prefoldin